MTTRRPVFLLPVFIEVNGRPWSFLLHFQKLKYTQDVDGLFKDQSAQMSGIAELIGIQL